MTMGVVADFFREQSIPLAEQPKKKMLALDRQFDALKAERDALKAENLKLQAQVNPLKREVERFKQQEKASSSGIDPQGRVCDHCGSAKVKRTGSRPHPTFGDVGVKLAVFSCGACGKSSEFMTTPPL
jgi:hypothetical protein